VEEADCDLWILTLWADELEEPISNLRGGVVIYHSPRSASSIGALAYITSVKAYKFYPQINLIYTIFTRDSRNCYSAS